jgi:hypothetical protein
MRVLLDSGVYIHAEFGTGAGKQTTVHWGGQDQTFEVSGVIRKPPANNLGYQVQKEALFTVGRLIREGQIEAFDYWEIQCERWRGSPGIGVCNALAGCENKIKSCLPALHRSKFRQSIDFIETISKGGKKDVDRGLETGTSSQIAFFSWLCSMTSEHADAFISHRDEIGLTPFDVESLRNLGWFRFLCERSSSCENYPDVFHLWTAERNGLDAVLTLDTRLSDLVARVSKEKVKKIEIRTDVLQPITLLERLGISRLDPVPMEANRFYYWHEVT